MIAVVFSCLLLSSLAAAQTCSTGGNGPCMNGICPMAGHTCTNDGEICCANGEILGVNPVPAEVVAPAPAPGPEILRPLSPAPQPQPKVVAPAPAPAGPCADNANITCAKYKKYCSVKEYHSLLVKHCPLTCSLCDSSSDSQSPASSGESCVDNTNPRNGRSNCGSMVQFCSHPRYKDIMAIQCRKTCGFC